MEACFKNVKTQQEKKPKWLQIAHPALFKSPEAPRSETDLKRQYSHPRRAVKLVHQLQMGGMLALLALQPQHL